MEDRDRCPGFGGNDCHNEAASPHLCPFNVEINYDETECECCEECANGCRDEI